MPPYDSPHVSEYDSEDIVRECVSCQRCYPPSVEYCEDCLIQLQKIETVPSTINYRYQLTKVIRRGGSGNTFLALDDSRQSVVLRIIRASVLADPRALDRFRREAGLACQFHHPNVARILDYGMLADASGYLVSEYVDGPSLRAVLKERGRLSVRESVRTLIDLCDALDAVHRAGLLHRDLKPESIILRDLPDIAETAIKLVGFSFARIAFGPIYKPGRTNFLQGLGHLPLSPAYLSPEQFRGEESDARSDIYSVGAIGYEMLAGRPPFEAGRTEDFAFRLLNESPPPLRSLNPAVEVEIEAEISRALEKDPQARHQRAVEMKRELINAAHLL